MEQRILIHAPRGRDADVIAGVLRSAELEFRICGQPEELFDAISEAAASAIVTEEAITDALLERLSGWLSKQPVWSDFQFVILASHDARRRTPRALASINTLGNVILLERPLNAQTLRSAAEAAVRARARQYATRRNLKELAEARHVVERLNGELEDRIASRTRQLAEANDRLMAEIAERERAQAALYQAQKMEALGRLTGGIAHDFNNVLHAVSMNIEMIERMSSEAPVRKISVRAKGAIQRGASLSKQLLSFARNQSLLPRPTDIGELLLGIKELVAVSVGPAIEVAVNVPDTPLVAMLDPTQLEMAVLNLAVNARDAMPNGGRLLVSSRRAGPVAALTTPGDVVVVSVEDTGTGMPANVLSKVFEPFFTTKPLGSGTGLGLSQVYGFARQSGGTAQVVSELGSGTAVEMFFPLAEPKALHAVDARAVEPTITDVSPSRILVVEDDPDVRRVIVESLGLLGHHVSEASDGPAGLSALRLERPDLMVVDYAMPGMTGAEFIDRARVEMGDIPVILATGYADMAEVGRVLGTRSILIKPFQIATLAGAVDTALHHADSMTPATTPT